MVKMRTATYFPRFAVGANSEVAARAVSSLIPAPAPANAMPAEKVSNDGEGICGFLDIPMKVFIVCAVEQTIMPRTMKLAPPIATYRRPNKSDSAPTNGQTAAKASKFARMNHTHLSVPPRSA